MDKSFFRASPLLKVLAAMGANLVSLPAKALTEPSLVPVIRERGKGGKRPHRADTGARRIQRRALKARDVKRNKRAHKGHSTTL
jgi:hypothetical protein